MSYAEYYWLCRDCARAAPPDDGMEIQPSEAVLRMMADIRACGGTSDDVWEVIRAPAA